MRFATGFLLGCVASLVALLTAYAATAAEAHRRSI